MDPTIAATVIGVLYPASLAVLVISFTRLRSDLHAGFDRLEARFDKTEEKFDAGFDKMDSRFDRLEAKFDDLELALVGKGQRTDLEAPSGADD